MSVIYVQTCLCCLYLLLHHGSNVPQANDAWGSTVDVTEYYVVPGKLRVVAE